MIWTWLDRFWSRFWVGVGRWCSRNREWIPFEVDDGPLS